METGQRATRVAYGGITVAKNASSARYGTKGAQDDSTTGPTIVYGVRIVTRLCVK